MAKNYRHFKGGLYKLVGIAKDSETLEEMVVYQAMYGAHQMWVRPKEMFFGKVERDGKVFDRFEEIKGIVFPDIEYTNQKLPLTLGEFSSEVRAMITLLQNYRIVPMGFFQGMKSDDDLEEEALRRIRNYQEGDDLESIFHLIQTWGGRTGRNIYVRGNGFNWSTIEPAYKELIQSCLCVQTLTENNVGYLSYAVDSFNQKVRHMGVAFITKHTRFWLHKSLGDNALPIYDSFMARNVMDKTEAISRDLVKYWTEMIKGARDHQVDLVPFERQLFRHFYNSRMKYKGFSFKYYQGEMQNPYAGKDENKSMWWEGEKLFYDSISRGLGDEFIKNVMKGFENALSDNVLSGKLLDKTISKKDRALIYFLDLWHGKWSPYDNSDEIRNY